MSIKKSGRPLVKVKTVSSTLTSSPTLTQDSIEVDAKSDARSDGFDDKSDEEMTDLVGARPLTVAIPRNSGFATSGPYCPRRPALSDILANNSPPPWTLSAFMAYLSQNHCLETLEFTMDSSRYRKHYNKMAGRGPGGQLAPGSDDCAYMLSLWQRLLAAYIVPNGPREVNIPSDVRDSLITYPTQDVPPAPSVLDIAVQKVYELMEESVLVPFLNSYYPQTAVPEPGENNSQEDLMYPSRSYDDRAAYRRSGRKERRSSPPGSTPAPLSASPVQNRASAPSSTLSQIARTLSTRHNSGPSRMSYTPGARTSTSQILSPSPSNPSDMAYMSPAEATGGLTDDNSSSSPNAFGEPMTPPNTPPQSDYANLMSSSVPPNFGGSRREVSGTWKQKVRSSFTFKKKSGSLREEETDAHGNFI